MFCFGREIGKKKFKTLETMLFLTLVGGTKWTSLRKRCSRLWLINGIKLVYCTVLSSPIKNYDIAFWSLYNSVRNLLNQAKVLVWTTDNSSNLLVTASDTMTCKPITSNRIKLFNLGRILFKGNSLNFFGCFYLIFPFFSNCH